MQLYIRSLSWFVAAMSIAIAFHLAALEGGKAIAQTPSALEANRSASPENGSAVEAFTVRDRLDESSGVLEDGSYYDTYSFEGIAGQWVGIELVSNEFDTYLLLRDPNGNIIAENDDSNGTNSHIAIELPTTGSYTIVAKSYNSGAIGEYTLSLGAPTEADIALAEANRFYGQGLQQFEENQYHNALQSFQAALEIYQSLEEPQQEASTLLLLGTSYSIIGQYRLAIDVLQQALVLFQTTEAQVGEGYVLSMLTRTHTSMGLYREAVELGHQALRIAEVTQDQGLEMAASAPLGFAYTALGNYEQGIGFSQRSLAIAQEQGNRPVQVNVLNTLGLAFFLLGDYQQAFDYHQQALNISREIEYLSGESASLSYLGRVAVALEQYQRANELYQQSLTIVRALGLRDAEAKSLADLSLVYVYLGQYPEAIAANQQALSVAREIGDRQTEANSLMSLTGVHIALQQNSQAMESAQQALAVMREIGDRGTEAVMLSLIGRILLRQNQPELAIVFLKESINLTEMLRGDIRTLSQEQQLTFIEQASDAYRLLANLLLQENRVLEAQRVLDLLKVQELDDYLQDVQRSGRTETGIDLAAPEAQIRDGQQAITSRAIAIGQELAQLRQIAPEQRSDEQMARIVELEQSQSEVVAQFEDFIYSEDVQALVAQLSRDTRQQDLVTELDELIVLQDNLAALNQNAVLIYPLILEDRLELVLVTPSSPPTRYPVAVSRDQLNETIVAFRQALQDPRSNPQPLAQQLYEWLIEPMAPDLAAIEAQTLLYAPDGVLRYIPLAALHDGTHWLAERFRINHITAASLSNLNLAPAPQPDILAAAFQQGSFSFEVGTRQFEFDGLPFAGAEVENLATTFPETRQYFDAEFAPDAIVPIMDDYTIVHLATHAAFVPGAPNDSFILFGNGDRITLEEIKSWRGRFRQIDLIVLSACETGVGDSLGNGEEILGFGYLMQQAGARAAIASLWSVSDGGTQVLMNAFYTALENGKSKAEALQLAQQALITGDFSGIGEPRGGDGTVVARDLRTGLSPDVSSRLNHPYYWAPFILIGNGL